MGLTKEQDVPRGYEARQETIRIGDNEVRMLTQTHWRYASGEIARPKKCDREGWGLISIMTQRYLRQEEWKHEFEYSSTPEKTGIRQNGHPTNEGQRE